MKRIILITAATVIATNLAFSQGTAINSTGAAADSSAMLDVSSTSKGQLIPRMTTAQQNSIVSPAVGLIVYNLDCNSINFYNGAAWISIGNIGSLTTPGSISGNTTPCENSTGVIYSVGSVSGATAYNWSVPSGSTVVSGQGTNSITVDFGTTNGNLCVTAFNSCGSSNAACMTISLQAQAASSSEGIHSGSGTQIIWNWYLSSGATGYKWNSTDDYNSALDMGGATSKQETGLSCNTNYTRYIWAYNSCGHSSSTQITQNSGGSQATGGTITYTDATGLNPRSTPPYTGGYAVHTFTSSGTFSPGNCGLSEAEVLVVAGGGGGAYIAGGGGGGGGVVYHASYSISGSVTVNIGNGGAGAQSDGADGTNGGNSEFGTITALGGGAGTHSVGPGHNGGSGGGAGYVNGCVGGSSTQGGSGGGTGYGNAGGNNYRAGSGVPYPSAGGGGAGTAGYPVPNGTTNGGGGGDGKEFSISGTATYYAGGGGGCSGSLPYTPGGPGGGGNGGIVTFDYSGTATDGTPNTGGGGGGGSKNGVNGAGNGGSGIVIVRYPYP